MKKIAIDLDGVVFDSENLFRVYGEIYDVDVLKKDSIIDNGQRTFQKRYNWSEEELKKFYNAYAKEIHLNSNIMSGATIVLEKLTEIFELIIVTARSDDEIKYTKQILKDIGLGEVPIFNNQHDKIELFINEGVNYIIDDDEIICKNASNKNIIALYFKNAAAKTVDENEYFKIVNNWGEIYKFLKLIQTSDI